MLVSAGARRRTFVFSLILALVVALLAPPQAPAQEDVPILDPIPEQPEPSGLGLTLEEVATFPKSEPSPPPTDPRLMRQARINFIDELPDGSGRMAVPDLNGKLYFVEDGSPTPYLDVGATFAPDFWSGRGLGSGFGFVAFHPEFEDNGKFYTVHTEALGALQTETPDLPSQPNPSHHGVLTEWTADDPEANTFSGTQQEMLRLGFTSFIHGFQQIGFNPTARRGDDDYGLLYVSVGDGGRGVASGDPQNLAMPQGKIFRIDPQGTNGVTGEYGIPDDNPFVNTPGALGETYAYGLRNPHRFSWDPKGRHRMFVGNIGEHNIESIYEVHAGDNFGWTEREGPFVVKEGDPTCSVYALPANDEEFGYTYPVAAYDHDRAPGQARCSDSGDAVIGGFVYRGDDAVKLRGKYVFGDDVNGRIWYTQANQMQRGKGLAKIYELELYDTSDQRVTMQDLAGDDRVDLRFGTDSEGELYLLSKANGKIWRVVDAERSPRQADVHPSLKPNLVAYYDFEHPVADDAALEQDQGLSGTDIELINGGPSMRVAEGAYPASDTSVQLQQVNPTTAGNDDWKTGIYSPTGVPSLSAFNNVQETTVMGWVKMTGPGPSPNSNTSNPNDFYNAIGLAGVLTGDSDGHAVRALLELINVNGELRLVALGRRIDGSASQTFAASEDWQTLLPPNEWVFLTATFDFDKGTMALYKNGEPLDGFYTVAGDPWGVAGPGPHRTSATDPRGIKIGGSFPQNDRETNPCNCRMDSLMFLDKAVSPGEVRAQYNRATTAKPTFAQCDTGKTKVNKVMAAGNWAAVTPDKWDFPGDQVILAEAGEQRPGPRRPFEYAVLTRGPQWESVEINAEVRLDTPTSVSNRDVIIVFGYRSDTEFYYAHLSQDNTIYPHNGIFVVNNADRLRIEHQWNGSVGAPPAVTDEEWHQVKLRHCADTGEIAVYVDGSKKPLMTATDTTFDSGRVGFGSFDNIGRLRNLTVTGIEAAD